MENLNHNDTSSTRAREYLNKERPDIEVIIPKEVLDYIKSNELYLWDCKNDVLKIHKI